MNTFESERPKTHADDKLPWIDKWFPMRHLQVEVVDMRLDHDTCVKLNNARKS